MSNSKELRIGNIVHATTAGRDGQIVERIIKDGLDIENAKWFFDIPLTEEWLVKFGFKISMLDYYSLGEFEVQKTKEGIFYGFENYQIVLADIKLNYVHQLQNLYFALTGEELTIK